jgi:hypothetical protein
MENKFFGLNWDFFGFIASIACALHCATVPILLTIGALGGLAWLEHPLVEGFFIVLSLLLASWSLIGSYINQHRNPSALVTVVLGFLLIITSRFIEGSAEAVLMVIGGLTIALAHYINWKLLKVCRSCVMLKS